MCQKLQGIVCLVVGFSLLAILIDPLAPQPLEGLEDRELNLATIKAPGGHATEVSVSNVASCRIDHYNGWFKTEKPGEERRWWKWNVDVLRLERPRTAGLATSPDANTRDQVVIHTTWQRTNSWGWIAKDEAAGSQVSWYTYEAPEVAVKRFETAGQIPALPSPGFFIEPESISAPHGTSTEESLTCRLLGIAKDIQFDWNSDQSTVERLKFRSASTCEPGGPIYTGDIHLRETRVMKPEENSILSNQLALWEKELADAERLVEMASESDRSPLSTKGYAQLLFQNYSHWARTLQTNFDQPLPGAAIVREGFRQSLVEPGLIRHRLSDAHARLAALSDGGILSLKPDQGDSSDVVEWDKQRDRVVVMGFVARRLDGSASVLAALDRLRRDFPDDGMFVVACSTDHSQENLHVMRGIDELSFPVVHGAALASQLELSSAGIPGILILDRHGRPRGLHAWQPHSTYEALRTEVHALLEEKPFSQSESLVSR